VRIFRITVDKRELAVQRTVQAEEPLHLHPPPPLPPGTEPRTRLLLHPRKRGLPSSYRRASTVWSDRHQNDHVAKGRQSKKTGLSQGRDREKKLMV